MGERTSEILYEVPQACRPGGFRTGASRVARLTVFAFALVGPGVVGPATAQTIGESGGVTAHSAAAASSMPKIEAPDLGNQTSSGDTNPASPSHTEEIRTYEVPSTTPSDKDDKDKDTNGSRADWEQVK
jgi:hypothetical protein